MSYLQPLITSAFATYSVSRSAYAGREAVTVQDGSKEDDNAFATTLSGVNSIQGVVPGGKIENVDGVGTAKSNENAVDRDAGKPRSESGDILDLSQESKDAYETQSDALEEAKTELNRQAEFESGSGKIESRGSESNDSISLESQQKASETADLESGSASELTPEEQEQVEELKARDAEVRTHEQAHVSAGGAYVTGGPSYTYQTGPDGKKYAIGGEVGIDTGEVSGDPEATIQKMQTVARAALAPAEPSSQDYKVAAAAQQKEAQARAELTRQTVSAMAGDENSNGESQSTVETETDGATQSSSTSESIKSFEATVVSSSKVSSQNSAYRAQSTMSLNAGPLNAGAASRFSAFA